MIIPPWLTPMHVNLPRELAPGRVSMGTQAQSNCPARVTCFSEGHEFDRQCPGSAAGSPSILDRIKNRNRTRIRSLAGFLLGTNAVVPLAFSLDSATSVPGHLVAQVSKQNSAVLSSLDVDAIVVKAVDALKTAFREAHSRRIELARSLSYSTPQDAFVGFLDALKRRNTADVAAHLEFAPQGSNASSSLMLLFLVWHDETNLSIAEAHGRFGEDFLELLKDKESPESWAIDGNSLFAEASPLGSAMAGYMPCYLAVEDMICSSLSQDKTCLLDTVSVINKYRAEVTGPVRNAFGEVRSGAKYRLTRGVGDGAPWKIIPVTNSIFTVANPDNEDAQSEHKLRAYWVASIKVEAMRVLAKESASFALFHFMLGRFRQEMEGEARQFMKKTRDSRGGTNSPGESIFDPTAVLGRSGLNPTLVPRR